MWLAPHVCNKTVQTSSIKEAEYQLISLETENHLLISWYMIRFGGCAISLLERQVENRRHITFLSFSFSLIQSIAQWHKLPNFFPLMWCVVKLPPLWVVCRRTALWEVEGSSLRLDVGRYCANFRVHHTKRMTERKRLETKENTKYSVLEITTTTLFRLTTSDNSQYSSVI